MSQQLHIRWSQSKDIPALAELNNLVWTERNSPQVAPATPEQYEQYHPVGSELVALSDGRLCGYIHMRTPSRMDSHQHVWELAIAVHPEAVLPHWECPLRYRTEREGTSSIPTGLPTVIFSVF
jgi:hypothetical protein